MTDKSGSPTANSLLNTLYERFYKGQAGFSEVTSSHWREVGWHKVDRYSGSWKLRGAGFGDRVQINLFNHIRNLGVGVALSRMQQHYGCPRDLWELGRDVARQQQRVFSFDCAKQILSLSKVLSETGGDNTARPLSSAGLSRVCVIGDGELPPKISLPRVT